jgi:hypothetical protein
MSRFQCYLRKIAIAVCLPLFVVIIFLSSANPCNRKWVYIFQRYICGRKICLPDNYTGRWLTWRRNGHLFCSYQFQNGKLSGEHIAFYNNGLPSTICNYKNGRLNGDYYEYDEDGSLLAHGVYLNGKKHSGSFVVGYRSSSVVVQKLDDNTTREIKLKE